MAISNFPHAGRRTNMDEEGCGCLVVIALIICIPIAILVYDSRPVVPVDEKIENIAQVMMHTPKKFTFYVKQLESHELIVRSMSLQYNCADAKIFTDVEPKNPMWAHYKKQGTNGNIIETLEIHIHKPEELVGGEYSTGGKHPQQFQTIPLK